MLQEETENNINQPQLNTNLYGTEYMEFREDVPGAVGGKVEGGGCESSALQVMSRVAGFIPSVMESQ